MDQLRQGRPGPRERRSEQGAKLQEEHRASTGLGNPYKATGNVGNVDLEPSAWYGRKTPLQQAVGQKSGSRTPLIGSGTHPNAG